MDAYVQMHEDDKIVESKDELKISTSETLYGIYRKAELNDMIKM